MLSGKIYFISLYKVHIRNINSFFQEEPIQIIGSDFKVLILLSEEQKKINMDMKAILFREFNYIIAILFECLLNI